MFHGKKSVAERIVYGALDTISKRSGQDPVKIFHEALENVKPTVEVRSRRVGGATYKCLLRSDLIARQALAIRWIIEASLGTMRTLCQTACVVSCKTLLRTGVPLLKARRYPSHGGR